MSNNRHTFHGISGSMLIAIALTVVCVTGFSHISFNTTFAISLSALVGLLVFFWTVGRRKRLSQGLRTDNANDTSGGV